MDVFLKILVTNNNLLPFLLHPKNLFFPITCYLKIGSCIIVACYSGGQGRLVEKYRETKNWGVCAVIWFSLLVWPKKKGRADVILNSLYPLNLRGRCMKGNIFRTCLLSAKHTSTYVFLAFRVEGYCSLNLINSFSKHRWSPKEGPSWQSQFKKYAQQ